MNSQMHCLCMLVLIDKKEFCDSPEDLEIIFAVDMESILILHVHRIPNDIKRFGIPVS